jgi:hypothetical protein
MVPTLRDFENLNFACPHDTIHKPVFLVDPPGPPPLKLSAQGFRFACPNKWVPTTFFDQRVELCESLGVAFLPPKIVAPRTARKDNVQG